MVSKNFHLLKTVENLKNWKKGVTNLEEIENKYYVSTF